MSRQKKDWDDEESYRRPREEPKDKFHKHRNAVYDMIENTDEDDDYDDEVILYEKDEYLDSSY